MTAASDNLGPAPVVVVELHDVTKRYGHSVALDQCTARLVRGTLTHVIGRNGSGKSTMLKLAAGIVPPTSGTVTSQAKRVAYVPERGDIGFGMTVSRYLHHMATIPGLPANEQQPQGSPPDVMARYGLSPYQAKQIRTLSKGTQKKVALAQAFLDPVDLLVLDEPTDGLDQAAIDTLRHDILTAARRGAAVLIACHTDHLNGLPIPTINVTLDSGRIQHIAPPPRAPGSPSALRRGHVLVETWHGEDLHRVLIPAAALPGVLSDAIAAGVQIHRVQPCDMPGQDEAPPGQRPCGDDQPATQ